MPLSSEIAILDERTETATGNVELDIDAMHWSQGVFLLVVTNAATDAGDTLDVRMSSGIRLPPSLGAHADRDIVWNDFIAFTQVTGDGTEPLDFWAVWNGADTAETEEGIPSGGTGGSRLTAGTVVQGPIARRLRVDWVVVDSGDADQTFTFAIYGNVWEDR